MRHTHQFVKKTRGFTLQHMGPKSRPTPKPHAASVQNKLGKIQSLTPKPWPKRRPIPVSLSSAPSTSTLAELDEKSNEFAFQNTETGESDELQLIVSQAFSPPPEGRILSTLPCRPQSDILHDDGQKQLDRILKWMEVLTGHSTVAEQLSRSKHPREHLSMMLKQIEPSTINRYLNGFEKFAQWIHFDHTVSWSTLQPHQLADFLVDTTKKTSDKCYKPVLLALTWASKTFGLPSFLTAIQSPIIQAFLNRKAKPPLNIGSNRSRWEWPIPLKRLCWT